MFPPGEEEAWTPVIGYEGMYDISNYGRLKSYVVFNEGRIMKPDLVSGYWRYALSHSGVVKRKTSHRLTAIHFVPNPENKPCVNHNDGCKTHNFSTNFKWVSFSENTVHALETGLITPVSGLTGEKNGKSKKVTQIDMNGDVIRVWDSANLAAIALKLNPSSIGMCCRGKKKKSHGGFIWKFKI